MVPDLGVVQLHFVVSCAGHPIESLGLALALSGVRLCVWHCVVRREMARGRVQGILVSRFS